MPGTYLKIEAESRGPASLLAVSGELDLTTASVLAVEAAGALAANPARLVVDLSGLTFTDTCGVRMLAALGRSADCPVIVRAACPQVRRVAHLAGITLNAGARGISGSSPPCS